MKQYDEYELKLIEWLKTFKNRSQLGNLYDSFRNNGYNYLFDISLPIVDTVSLNKEKIILLAKEGKNKPKNRSKLGRAYYHYTNKNDSTYDKNFTKELKQLRPDWFQSRVEKSFKLMKDLIPKGTKFVEGQEWRGSKYTHKFLCEKFGEFQSIPIRLMRTSWKKGLSGHPKHGSVSRAKKAKKRLTGIKNNHSSKKIFCKELDIIFPSAAEAIRKLKVNRSSLFKVLKGKQESTGGYTFVYVEEEK